MYLETQTNTNVDTNRVSVLVNIDKSQCRWMILLIPSYTTRLI